MARAEAFDDASELAHAVSLIEHRGHKLKTWQRLVDEVRTP